MRLNSFLCTIFLMSLIAVPAFAVEDYSRWVGNEPKEMPTLLSQFQKSCERKYQSRIEKFKQPFATAVAWNKAHCECIQRFFAAKDDVTFVQIVNLDLKKQLETMPRLPGELNIYLTGFDSIQVKCQTDPKYISEDMRAQAPAEGSKKNMSPPGGAFKAAPKGIPFQPQKSGPGVD